MQSSGSQNIPDREIHYWPNFLTPDESRNLFDGLREHIAWRQDEIRLFGRVSKIPRLQGFVADRGIGYTYSGIRLIGNGFDPLCARVKQDIEETCGELFNAVLLNLYRDGHDSMGWHSDNEPELGDQPIIASLSLGETRTLRFRDPKKIEPNWSLELENGSLLLLGKGVQQRWQHSVPKRTRSKQPRMNLTFRNIRKVSKGQSDE